MPAPIPANRFDVWTFPTFEEWMKGTALGITSPRSDKLKKIDAALKAYQLSKDDGKLSALRMAFRDWCTWKGSTKWESSERNTPAKGALFTRLDKALRSTRKSTHAVDQKALEEQENLRRLAVMRLFIGKKVTLRYMKAGVRSGKILDDVKDTYSNIKKMAPTSGNPSTLSEINSGLQTMIAGMFDVSSYNLIMPHLLHVFGGDLLASMVPLLGHFRSGAMVVKDWTKVAIAGYSRSSNADHGYVFGAGDPAAAFKALDTMLKIDIIRKTGMASITSADFAVRTALAVTDLGGLSGPITGAATAVAKLTKRIYEVASEYRETKAVQKLMLDPRNLGMKLFTTKPLLGCYMICCANDWELINMASAEFGMDGWMDDVEAIKRDHITPVRKTAHAFIESDMYEIAGLTSLATRPISVNGLAKSAKNKLTSHKKMEGFGPSAATSTSSATST
jgi:hypothetical protein